MRKLLLVLLVFVAWTGAVNAATITSTATGGAWATKGTWVGNTVPATSDTVIIATTGAGSVNIAANVTQTAAGSVTINSGAVLTMSGGTITFGALTINSGGSATLNRNTTIRGITNVTGNLNFTSATARTITFTGAVILNSGAVWNEATANTFAINDDFTNNATTFTASTGTHSFGGVTHIISGSTATIIPGTATFTGPYTNNGIFSAATLSAVGGTAILTNNGTVTVSTALSGSGGFTQGTTGVFNFNGATIAATTFSASAAGNTVNYTGAAQTVRAVAYSNLILSGSGAKSMAAGTSVTSNLSISPTGSATASVAAGQNLTINTLTLGGVGTVSGTWGSTSSSATNKNNTYFAATTGILTVSVSTANPVPTTTSISPTSTTAGGSQFTLTVNGTNFVTNSLVYWNGSARTTTFVSATQLTATIPANDVAAVGTASVTVVNPTPGGGTSNAQVFTITTITPTKFVILPPTNGTVDAPITITVEAQDNAGNIATSYQQDVTLLKSGSATGGGLVNIINGVGTTTISDTVAETVHLTLSDTQGTGLTISSSQDVVFSAGATSQLFLSGATTTTAGTRAAFTVTRKDQHGNLRTNGSETFYLYSDSAGAAKRFYDAASAGNIVTSITIQNSSSAANFWYYDELAGSANIAVSDGTPTQNGNAGIIDGTGTITITPASPAQFTLNTQTSMTAGARLDYVVTRKDSFGNNTTLGTSTVYLFSNSSGVAKKFYDAANGGNIITSIALAGGVTSANFWYYDELAGSVNITASDNISGPDSAGIIDATSAITINPGPTGKFLLNDPGNMTAGTRLGYTVTREDSFGNIVTLGSNTIYLYSGSTGATKAFYDAASSGNTILSVIIGNGASTANFWYYDELPGTWTITASDNNSAPDSAGIIDGTDTVIVNTAPIVATRITITQPTDGVVGSTIPVTVRAEDNAGNLDTTYNNSTDITLRTSGSATPQNGVVLTIMNGVGSVNITDTVAEPVTLSLTRTASSTLDVSSTKTVTFTVGPTAQYILNNPGDMTAGARLHYVVTRKDSFGNLVTSSSNIVHLTSNATGGLSAFYNVASGGSAIPSITIPDGASTAEFWYYEGKAGTWTITASGDTGITDGTRSVVVSPAATSQFLIDNPGDMMAGTRIGYTVTRKDQFGNLVTSGDTTMYVYSNSNSTSSAFYNAAANGNTITSRIFANGASTVQFWYYEEKVGTWTITTSDNSSAPDLTGITDASVSVTVSSIPIVATRFAILDPSDTLIGTNTTVTIRAEDNAGNIQTTYNNNVTLVVSGSATGGGVVTIQNGVGTKTISDTVAETVFLSLLDTASTTLDVSSVQSVTFSAQPIVTAGGGALVTGPIRSTVIFSGTAFPGAKLTIVGTTNGDVPVRQGTTAQANGSFSIRFNDLTPGIRSYFLSVTDNEGRLTQTKVYTMDVNQPLIVRDVFLPPTIGFAQPAVLKGGFLGIKGFATPGATIVASIDGKEISTQTTAKDSGEYLLASNTIDLTLGIHSARVVQINGDGTQSDSSIEQTFRVTNLFVPQTDLNGDGTLNASDLSIFLAKWLSADATTRRSLDFNGDGKVDIQDLSIFARTLPR
ncbi:MAG: dockerin type I domain-containing protein [Candidatus Paceibacterota bacterium]